MARWSRRINDVQHLAAHHMAGHDAFVTSDHDDIVSKREQLWERARIRVYTRMSPYRRSTPIVWTPRPQTCVIAPHPARRTPVQSVQQPVLVQPAGSISPTRRWLRTALRAYAPTVSFWAPP